MERKLIDTSQYNGVIDWAKVKPNIDGAILRCGYGQDLKSQDDKQFMRNARECERLGIPYGVYLYSYAKTERAARGEAVHALRLIEGRNLTFPVYFDSEELGTEKAAKKCAIAFCKVIAGAGYTPGVYASESWWRSNLKGVDQWSKWVAKWSGLKPSISNFDIWQYSDKGRIPGIKGNVDLDRCYKDFGGKVKTVIQLAKEVINGQWGNGAERKARLTAAGYDYDAVQKQVNEILKG